jgi:subtilisin family serine protease
MTRNPIRYYVVLKNTKEYFHADFAAAKRYLARQLYGPDMVVEDVPFDIAALPSTQVHLDSQKPVKKSEPEEIVVALYVRGNSRRSPTEVLDDIIATVDKKPEVFAGGSPDIPFASSDHWCIGDAGDSMFSDRSAAERLVRIDELRQQSGTTGTGVNVVIADQGLDAPELGASYGGGWQVGAALPGTSAHAPGSIRRSHGMMIAHNILAVAPDALLFDLPLAPPKIANIMHFLSLAQAAYHQVLSDIQNGNLGNPGGPWIFVNPWGIYDRSTEQPLGEYTTKLSNPFNQLILKISQKMDVVFAAGNCGQFCPDMRCGAEDQGPGYSIWGANSLEQVLTVGAVRADSMWLGYSAQGPGQIQLGKHKPDLCAASQFRENDDAFTVNTGTSAACGLTGGVVAALRSRWNSTTVSPHQLKHALNQSARKPPGLGWNNSLGHRLGNGILDAKAAFDQLKSHFPP